MTSIKTSIIIGIAVIGSASLAGVGAVKAHEGPRAHMKTTSAMIDLDAPSSAVSCRQASNILAKKGYTHIKSFDCVGMIYRFTVRKNGAQMVVLMNAQSAGYVEVY